VRGGERARRPGGRGARLVLPSERSARPRRTAISSHRAAETMKIPGAAAQAATSYREALRDNEAALPDRVLLT